MAEWFIGQACRGRSRVRFRCRRARFLKHCKCSRLSSPPHFPSTMNYYSAQNMASSWRTVRNNTLQIAEEIPADKYHFRATDDTMTVAEILGHMATNTLWAVKVHVTEKLHEVTMQQFGEFAGMAAAATKALDNKDAIVAALKTNGEEFARGLESLSDETLGQHVTLPGGSKTRFEMLLGLKEHEMHHRGQLMLMERLMGIVPHLTRMRQERMAAARAAASAPTATV